MIWWEIYSDTGALVVERFEQGWKFIPNAPAGRPRKKTTAKQTNTPLSESLPLTVLIDKLMLDGQPVAWRSA